MNILYTKQASKDIQKLVKAWDPDFTKLTKYEKEEIDEALKETEFLSHDEVWG